jgi:hypothetical protein
MAPTPGKMSELAIREHLPSARLEESYKIPFSKHEVQFLCWFFPEALADVRHGFIRILEVLVLHDLYQRLGTKLYAGQDCKMKLKAADVLALKRVLIGTSFISNWGLEHRSVIAKLDQLTVGIK